MKRMRGIKSIVKDNLKNTILAGQSLAVLLVTIVVLLLICKVSLLVTLICIPLNFVTIWLTILLLWSYRKTLEYSEDPFYIFEPSITLIITVIKFAFLTVSKTLAYLPKVIFIILFFIALIDWNSFLNLKEALYSASPESMQRLLRFTLYLTTFVAMIDVIIHNS